MKKTALFILTLSSLTSFSQSIETITAKVSDKICACIKTDLKAYAEIKPEYDRCFVKEFNQIFSLVDSSEQKILTQPGALDKIKTGLIPTLNSNCEKIRKVIRAELDQSMESTANNSSDPCPINFSGEDFNNIPKLNGEIIAFNGLITKVFKAYNNKPYYEVKLEGGNTIWIASLVTSGFEVEGNILRIMGYVGKVDNDEQAKKYNKTAYHVFAFCIIDLKTKQMSMLPSSELQIQEWIAGRVPKARK